jgi:hypothetical protein
MRAAPFLRVLFLVALGKINVNVIAESCCDIDQIVDWEFRYFPV